MQSLHNVTAKIGQDLKNTNGLTHLKNRRVAVPV